MSNIKENIIKALKENKKLIFVIGVVFISGILVGFSISTIELPKSESKTKLYVAIDDIGISGGTNPFDSTVKITYDSEGVSIGYMGGSYRGFIMRFDLSNKPKSYSECIISIYQYYAVGGVGSDVYLFEGNWTEKEWDGYGVYMRDTEIYWKIEEHVGHLGSMNIGFKFINITEYINNITTSTFSIGVIADVYGNWGNGFYSSEWNNTNIMLPFPLCEDDDYEDYLPQLIWS